MFSYYCLPLGRAQGDISNAMDKMVMRKFAEKVKLNVPYTYSLDELRLRNIEFPIIIKPLSSVEGNKSDIKIIKNEYELSRYMDLHKNKPLIAQDYNRQTNRIPVYRVCFRPAACFYSWCVNNIATT